MFGYNINKKAIYIVLGVLVVWSFLDMSSEYLKRMLLTLPAVIVAITFHEFAHAFAADKLGDTTPRNQGRLTLNPLSHLDPFGFLLLMFAHIGWGKPVQINPNNFNSNKSLGFCESMVSLAGPLMNLFIATVCTVAYVLIMAFGGAFWATQTGAILVDLIAITISINIGLGVFNLIPLPPLDGEKIFRNLLPYRAQQWLTQNYETLYLIFMILWFFGVLEVIVSPIIDFLSNALVYVVITIVEFFI